MQRRKPKPVQTQQAASGLNGQTKPAPRQAQRQGSHSKEAHDPTAPTLAPCSLLGPDGKERPAWELWVGEELFGRADSKESLLQYYARIHEPPPSGHWRERPWQPRRRAGRRARQEYDEHNEAAELETSELAGGWD